MDTCDFCGEEVRYPFTCDYCENKHCSDHRLYKNHECPVYIADKANLKPFESDAPSTRGRDSPGRVEESEESTDESERDETDWFMGVCHECGEKRKVWDCRHCTHQVCALHRAIDAHECYRSDQSGYTTPEPDDEDESQTSSRIATGRASRWLMYGGILIIPVAVLQWSILLTFVSCFLCVQYVAYRKYRRERGVS